MLWDYIFTYLSIATHTHTHTLMYTYYIQTHRWGEGVSFIHSGPAVTRTVLAWRDDNQHNKYGSCPYQLKASVQLSSLSCVWLSVTPWTAAHQASLSIINSRSLFKLMSIESVMPSNHLILSQPLLLPPSIFPSISLSKWVSSSHQVVKVQEFQLRHQSFQWIFL